MTDKKKAALPSEEPKKFTSTYLRDLAIRERRVFLQGVLEGEVVDSMIQDLLLLDAINHDPITMVINSPGGLVTGTLAIIDVIENIKSPVNTVIIGTACSGAALISIAGKKRSMTKRAIWMIHPMASGVADYHAFMKDKMEGLSILDGLINEMVKKHCKLPKALLKKYKNGEVWLDAKTCKQYKIIDEITTSF